MGRPYDVFAKHLTLRKWGCRARAHAPTTDGHDATPSSLLCLLFGLLELPRPVSPAVVELDAHGAELLLEVVGQLEVALELGVEARGDDQLGRRLVEVGRSRLEVRVGVRVRVRV